MIAYWKISLAATSAKLANYVGGRGGKLAWRQYAPNWKITMALDSGQLRSATEMERYYKALEWAKRVIALAEEDNE